MGQLRKRHGGHYNWKAILKSSWKAILMLLLAGSVLLFQYPESMAIPSESALGPPSSDSRRVIFLISMGQDAANGKIVERCLLSIRRRGNWNGFVVLLTDAPPARYLPSEQQDDHLIVMHPRKQDFKWGDEINDVPYKRFKMMQLNYIDLDPRLADIDLVYYLDIDIVVGAELSKFFTYTEEKYSILGKNRNTNTNTIDTSVPVPKAFFFKGNFAEYPLQGGQFVLERPYSQYCMDLWLTTFDGLLKKTKDQTALRVMTEKIAAGEETKCELVVMEQAPHLFFPKHPNEMAQVLKKREYVTLNHFKNTGTEIAKNQELQEELIAALLNMNKKELVKLGLAKTIIFQPSDSKWANTTQAKL
jgi:hypothetical protein